MFSQGVKYALASAGVKRVLMWLVREAVEEFCSKQSRELRALREEVDQLKGRLYETESEQGSFSEEVRSSGEED